MNSWVIQSSANDVSYLIPGVPVRFAHFPGNTFCALTYERHSFNALSIFCQGQLACFKVRNIHFTDNNTPNSLRVKSIDDLT